MPKNTLSFPRFGARGSLEDWFADSPSKSLAEPLSALLAEPLSALLAEPLSEPLSDDAIDEETVGIVGAFFQANGEKNNGGSAYRMQT
jgi:hypothetical protein